MPGLSSLYVKLIGGLVVALLLLGLFADRGRWMHRAHGDEAQLATICAATRAAAANSKLDCKAVPQQIAAIGQSLEAVTAALTDQNARVAALAAQSATQQAASAQASRNAQERAGTAAATSRRLTASSRSSAAQARPCAPSKALTEAWQ